MPQIFGRLLSRISHFPSHFFPLSLRACSQALLIPILTPLIPTLHPARLLYPRSPILYNSITLRLQAATSLCASQGPRQPLRSGPHISLAPRFLTAPPLSSPAPHHQVHPAPPTVSRPQVPSCPSKHSFPVSTFRLVPPTDFPNALLAPLVPICSNTQLTTPFHPFFSTCTCRQGTPIHVLEPPPPPRASIFPFYTCFLSFSSPPPPPPPEEPGSQAKVSHLIRSLQWCQPLHTGKKNQSRPRGGFPCESEHLLGTRPTGHPAQTHAQTEVLGTRVGGRMSVLNRPQTQPTSLQPFAILVSRGLPVHSGSAERLPAEWQLSRAARGRGLRRERGGTPRPASAAGAEQRRTL